MARAPKTPQLIEFKGTTLPVVSITVRELAIEALARAASDLFGDEAFFDGDTAILELDALESDIADTPVDWPGIQALFTRHGLRLIGVRGGSEVLRERAAMAGLPSFAAFKRPVRKDDVPEPEPEPAPVPAPPPAVSEPPPVPPPPPTAGTVTLVIDRPLRSGQQAYARGGDLVVLAAVNPGAEVIADGSIHIYAPLRGRALAGASGNSKARIFTTRFEAELVSVAGVYRTFESGVPGSLGGKPVQVRLSGDADADESRLSIESLSID